jgi:hypothetical protein
MIRRQQGDDTMLKTLGLMMAASLAAIAIAVPANAHSKSFDTRQAHQADRIEHGRQSGRITWTEGRKLRAQQRRIAQLRQYFLRDGRIDHHERAVLRQLQNDASASITAEARDARRRAPWAPRVGR